MHHEIAWRRAQAVDFAGAHGTFVAAALLTNDLLICSLEPTGRNDPTYDGSPISIRDAQMHRRDDDELGPGKRIKLSALGKLRCPKLKTDTGIVVGKSPQSNAFRVLIDGRKMPITLHESYIEAQ